MYLLNCKLQEATRKFPCEETTQQYMTLLNVDVGHNFINLKKYDSVILYGKEYHKGSAILMHTSELFSLTRKSYQLLNNFAKNSINVYGSFNSEINEFAELRGNIVSFLHYVLNYLNLCASETGQISMNNCQSLLSSLKISLNSFRRLLRCVSDLPDFILYNSTSAVVNEFTLATYHLFHLHLELLWLFLLIKRRIILLSNRNLPIVTDEQIFDETHVKHFDGTKELELELKWTICSLIALSAVKYDMVSSQADGIDKDLFTCNCVKELWIGLQFFTENSSEPHLKHFWHYYNDVVYNNVFTKNVNEATDVATRTVLKFPIIKSDNLGAFILWQLYNVSVLQAYQSDGTYTLQSLRITSNYELLEKCLKNLFNDNSLIPEIQLRWCIKQLIELTEKWWESKSDVINVLWEYFHKRLNSTFTAAPLKDGFIAFADQSIIKIAKKLQCHIDGAETVQSTDSSFSMFLHLLGVHLKKHYDLKQISQCQKIKGRIYPKFTQTKLSTLTEVGLQNFTMLYIVMGISTDVLDVCEKLHNLLIQVPFEGSSLNQKCTLIKAHLLICLLYVKYEATISQIVKPILSDITNISNQRDPDSMYLLKHFMEGVIDILASTESYQQDEHVLIGTWFNRYLSSCSIRNFSYIIESLNACIPKRMYLSTQHNVCTIKMHEMLSCHVFSCVKQTFVNGTMVLQVAELSYHFSKMTYNNKDVEKYYGDFDELISYFILSDNANVNVIRAFTIFCLKDEQFFSYFDNHKKLCSLLIHSWIRCTMMCDENHKQENMDMSLLIMQLTEFQQIQVSPCIEDSPQEYICSFIHSIGNLWKTITSFQGRCQLREQMDIYFKTIDKYTSSALKHPTTYEATMQIITTLSTLIFHCSPLIYSRGKPTCVLHCIVGNILLPAQVFIDIKKLHIYFVNSVCKCWFMIMYGLFQLDYNNDIYIEKAMKDMIAQYLPCFAVKTLSNGELYDIPYRIFPATSRSDLMLEKYTFEKVSSIFFTCHGKQVNSNAVKVLAVIYHTMKCDLNNVMLMELLVSTTFLNIFEQLVFTDIGSANRKFSSLIISLIFTNELLLSSSGQLMESCKKVMVDLFTRHLPFNSQVLIKAICTHSADLQPILKAVIPQMEAVVANVEKLRGVGYDTGLRNGLCELIRVSSI